jgi:hypothetical protein
MPLKLSAQKEHDLHLLFPIGGKHEVIDDQLGAPVEEIGERKSAIRSLKLVGLFHALPGHRHSAARQRITLAREFLLGSEQFKARLQPFLVRDHFVVGHERLLLFSTWPFSANPRRNAATGCTLSSGAQGADKSDHRHRGLLRVCRRRPTRRASE